MSKLQCGFSRTVITPKPGEVYLDGYGHRLVPAQGVYSDLYVNVCTLVSGGERFLIASFDLCGMNRRVYDILCGQISEQTGLDRSHMALCATHTHSGPGCGVLDPVPVNYDYYMLAGTKAGKCAAEAFAKAVPGSFECRIAGEITGSRNRRNRAPIDHRVKTLVFADESGKVRGSVVNVSCHAVINTSLLISADYPGILNRNSSDDCPTVFLAGRGADSNPANMGVGDMDGAIEALGGEVWKLVEAGVNGFAGGSVVETEVSPVYETVTLPMKAYPALDELESRIREQRGIYLNPEKSEAEKHYAFAELNWLYMAKFEREAGHVPELRVPLQIVPLGEILFAFVPFELLTLTGDKIEAMAVKRGYAPEKIFVIGYANTVNSYLAPAEEFAYGGYEVSGASHWYRIPECVPETEAEMLAWFEKKLG